jgi:glycosyltransferase involved in cell wall biosynthesis
MVAVTANGRVMLVPSNGQQRVAKEIITRLNMPVIAPPASRASGAKGHLWEQAVLPVRLRGRPLWSPSTSAPMFYRNQVVTVHDLGFVDVPQYFAPRFAATYRTIVKRVARVAKHLITVSEFSRRRIIEQYGLPESQVSAVYLGISEAFSLRSADDVAAVREEFGIGSAPYVIAFSGNDPRKNTQGILDAWEELGAKRDGAKLVLFGRSSNASIFNTASGETELTDVIRVGGISDETLAALFSGANGLVFPSFYEGFGLPIVEAAASGAPIITTGFGAMAEIAPRTALLVDPQSRQELAKAMLDCLGKTPDDATRRELSDEMKRYNWNDTAAEYRRIFAATFGD